MPDAAVDDLASLARCPACRGVLAWQAAGVRCRGCGRSFPIVDGVACLAIDDAAADPVDHKARQAAFFADEADAGFEMHRPHGAPAFHGWLLTEKLRKSVTDLAPALRGATVLTVCGGSGMDAEFLTYYGARVIASDLSVGAARRVKDRAERFELPITPLVADVEQLPFADKSVDFVYVHDGLHHLEDPLLGLREMARVARRGVSVTEPHQALATRLAVKLGWALEYEEAGNRVARLTLAQVADELRRQGFRVLSQERYAMYYKHQPGLPARWLSRRAVLPVATRAHRQLNRIIGSIGNKMVVQAARPQALR